MEDDTDWDVRIKEQLRDFATAAHALVQPAARTNPLFPASTYVASDSNAFQQSPEFDLRNLPSTVPPTRSPYGDNWDLLWLGHCGMRFPFEDGIMPKGRVIWTDHTVPQQQYLWTISVPDDLKEQYPNHTRVVHCQYCHRHVQPKDPVPELNLIFIDAQEPVCTLAYAITQKAARQILYEIGLQDVNMGYDLLLQRFCDSATGRRAPHRRCLTMQPSLFQHHRPVGPKNAESDITDHGGGWRDRPHTNVLRWSVRMNAGELIDGGAEFEDQWPDV